MNNIEKCLNEFFKELQHTPGPWKFEDEFIRATILENDRRIVDTCADAEQATRVEDYGNMIADPYVRPSKFFNTEIEANSKLISRAPDMLRSICRTYLFLLVKFPFNDRQNSTVREIRITLDGTLSSLRNEISNATGLECQHIQDTFEQYATWIEQEE